MNLHKKTSEENSCWLSLFFIILAVAFATTAAFPQGAAINTTGNAAAPSAIFDISSGISGTGGPFQGLLIPRMTTNDRNLITSPAQSLLIYNLTTKCFEMYENSIWQPIYCAISTPSAAGNISGSSVTCLGQNNVTYSVPSIQYATSYIWSYSGTGATIVGTGSTVSINFSSSATSGNLTVKGSNSLGDGPASANFPITVAGSSGAAGSISGSMIVCQGQNGLSYSVNPINNATNYIWSYTGARIIINGSSNSVTIDFSLGATSGYLTVKGSSSCGDGTVSTNFPISVNPLPVAPVALSGTNDGTNPQTKFTANWNSAATANGYYLDVSTTSDFSSFVSGYSNLDVSNVTTYDITGLSCGTTYYYRVRAYNYSCGAGAYSDTISYSTNACFSLSGGTVTTSGNNTIHEFTSSGTLTVTGSGNAKVLVVAGGGGGASGGGGGGGVLYNTSYTLSPGTYTVTVGAGGTGGNNTTGGNGENSVFGTMTALGGGGGGCNGNGATGGSGGGASGGSASYTGGAGTSGHGNAGGNCISAWTPGAGGGGGAGTVGGNGVSTSRGGNGGYGIGIYDIYTYTVYFGGGGGGGNFCNVTGGFGGTGQHGGGNGCSTATPVCAGTAGSANTGGGGGGGGGSTLGNTGPGGSGGSGIVIICYPTP